MTFNSKKCGKCGLKNITLLIIALKVDIFILFVCHRFIFLLFFIFIFVFVFIFYAQVNSAKRTLAH